ncbi:molybdopterin cofactor-binding domain-containing protein [Peristeroidobacter soli]|uniref:molybdopterin cofactor-binding domain-containing protein n=1 Tax=Peristeroidobacter soli TaxID=2497877 RepID=UPI00101DDE22|nr:molybdopterin cofactor-binding domain-containing protein [Peristeroidobacter soli]
MSTPDTVFSIYGATLNRRSFLVASGSLVVALGMKPAASNTVAAPTNSLDATQPSSWIEIHADNTLVIRTGKCDFGQSSIYTAYRQIVAEELDVPVEAITTVISGDTDRTPDGGGTFGLLRTNVMNLRKAAAYTREAALELAARNLGVPRTQLKIANGVIAGGGKSVTYGALVAGESLQLTIPVRGNLTDFGGLQVAGDPPLKPTSSYTVVGQPIKNPSLRPKMSGEALWVNDVKLPGMLHARVVHPATLGSTLVSAGKVDKSQFPNTQVVVIGNLVGVLAPDEWEVILAAQVVGANTKWSEWKGLPGHRNLLEHLQSKVDWNEIPAAKGAQAGDAVAASAKASKTHSGTYFVPYHKHAPISPTVSLADVKPNGSVTLHTHSQNPQFLRMAIAKMLGRPETDVVIRTYPGASHFGRSNGGNAGSEDEAVLLSRAVGKPVRVQWMRPDDMQWSTQSSASMSKIRISLDEKGKIQTYQADHSGPPMQDDRPIGALLAGLPTIEAPGPNNASRLHSTTMNVADRWVYTEVPNVAEAGHGTYQIGQRESAIGVGLRDHSMRTPIQFQQNFPREAAISEAAALAGADPIQFRIDHTKEERFKTILARLREESGWQTRPSPAPSAGAKESKILRGQGASIMLRDNGYWACACHVAVTPETGEVRVERLTIVVDPGIVVNPLQLKRQVQAGSLMGVSQALHEEVMFDEGAITSTHWGTYPILTMAEMPEVKVVIAGRPEFGVYGQGSESANALAAPAIVAAFFDATGRPARRIPLRPEYVKSVLAS